MKTLKPFLITLLVVLVAILTSCSNNNSSTENPANTGYEMPLKTDEMFAKYIGDYSNITCRTFLGSNDGKTFINSVYLSKPTPFFYFFGIKNKHLWFSQFDLKGNLVETWEDKEETDSVFKINKGYGKYEMFQIKSVVPYSFCNYGGVAPFFYIRTDTGNILLFQFFSKGDLSPNSDHISLARMSIFTSNNKSKHLRLDYQKNFAYTNEWYNSSLFIGDQSSYCCYSQAGDTLYVSSNYKRDTYVPASYEEGIAADSAGDWPMKICRDNFKTGNNVWTTECKAPFDVPTNANPKYTSTLLDKSTDVWKYKVNMVYYDGTKKEFTFTININTGEYKASV